MPRYSSSRAPRGLTPKQISSLIGVVIALVIFAVRTYQQNEATRTANVPNTPAAKASATSNLLLGNPSNAATDRDNCLLQKPYFTLSYNNTMGEPNWVSWRLTRDDLGVAARKEAFDPDDSLPWNITKITTRDYTGSGFDRGHMCPHGDRTKNLEMSYATFIMTNIVPQSHNLNEKAWDSLEMYCRQLATNEHDRVYIISGPAGRGGTGLYGKVDTIANGKVVVPAVCWKVIVAVPDDGSEDLSDVTASTRVIAAIMPNDQNVSFEWDQYRVSVYEVEKLTGYHFFTALPPDIAGALKSKVDQTRIPPPERREYSGEKRTSKTGE